MKNLSQKIKEIEEEIMKIENLGYIVKINKKGFRVIEIYQSILNKNRIIQHEIASATNPMSLDFLKEIYQDLIK